MKKAFLFCLAAMFATMCVNAKINREFRATWVTTVWGIDWPKTQINLDAVPGAQENFRKQQKAELCAIFDSLKNAGMNAAFFQVRGMSDAMYKSEYENWCQYLTGKRGGDPGYDPLEFAIEEAHKRGLELHAWLNPYRYSSSDQTFSNLENDHAKQHPDWIMKYGDGVSILNPGLPEVRKHITKIIGDIVNRYDIDGIVFDDYFYAYGGTNSTQDADAQKKYKPQDMDLGDWRRQNVNMMVKAVYDTIQAVKPFVKFGISPFGTWTSDKKVADKQGLQLPSGVGRTGDMYHEIYCDPIAWLKEGTVDYVSPQLYWTTDSPYPFGNLSDWWSQMASQFGRHFYASHSVSSLRPNPAGAPQQRGLSSIEAAAFEADNAKKANAKEPQKRIFYPSEIMKQVNYNRMYDLNDAPGSVFYNTSNTINTRGFVKYLRKNVFKEDALTPCINWKNAANMMTPDNVSLKNDTLRWNNSNKNTKTIVYAIPENFKGKEKYSTNHVAAIIYVDNFLAISKNYKSGYTFAVAAYDRYGNISAPQILNGKTTEIKSSKLIYPENNSNALLPCVFEWSVENDTTSWIEYQWQLAQDEKFDSVIATRNTDINSFNSTNLFSIRDGKTYYWRVRTIKEGGISDWSEAFKFTSKIFSINDPINGQTDMSATPTISWDKVEGDAKYILYVANTNEFLTKDMVFKKETKETSITIPDETLKKGFPYYAKVEVYAGKVHAVSPTITFYTKEIEVPVPVIISPKQDEQVNSKNVTIKWQEQPSNGFRIELANAENFPPRSTKVKKTDGYTFEHEFTNLKEGVYYVRIKAERRHTSTDFSKVVKFEVKTSTAVEDVAADNAHIVNLNDETIALYPGIGSEEINNITIYSISGAIIYSNSKLTYSNAEYITLNINNLQKGIYLLKFNTNKGAKILKFQK